MSIAKFIIKILTDRAAYKKTIDDFTNIEDRQKKIKKGFMDMGDAQKQAFGAGSAAADKATASMKSQEEQVKKLTRQIKALAAAEERMLSRGEARSRVAGTAGFRPIPWQTREFEAAEKLRRKREQLTAQLSKIQTANKRTWATGKKGIKENITYADRLADRLEEVQLEITGTRRRLERLQAEGNTFQRSFAQARLNILDDIQGRAADAESFRGLRRAEKDLKDLNDGIDKFNNNARKADRRTSILNTRFGDFSIIMSGIAATLFVWQELLQFIRLIASVTGEAEASMAKFQVEVGGTAKEIDAMYQAALQADISGLMNIGEATDQLKELRTAGYSAAEAIDILGVRMDRIEETSKRTTEGAWKRFVGQIKDMFRIEGDTPREILNFLADAVKRQREFVKNFNEAAESGDKEAYRTAQRLADVGRVAPDSWRIVSDSRLAAEAAGINLVEGLDDALKKAIEVSGSQSGVLFVKAFAKEQANLRDTLYRIRSFVPDDEEFGFIAQALQFEFDEAQFRPVMKALGDFYRITGRWDEEYFKRREARIIQDFKVRKRLFEEVGVENAEVKAERIAQKQMQNLILEGMQPRFKAHKEIYDKLGIMTQEFYDMQSKRSKFHYDDIADLVGEAELDRLRSRAEFNLELQKYWADEVKVSKNAIKAMEKVFKETGFMSPALIRARRADIEIEQRRLARVTGQHQPGVFINTEAQKLRFHRELQLFEDQNKAKIDTEKEYFKETKIMSEELFNYRKRRIELLADIMALDDSVRAEAIKNKRLQALNNEYIKNRLNAHRKMQSTLGGYSQAHYDLEIKLLQQQRDHTIEVTGDMVNSWRAYNEEVKKMDIERLLKAEDAASGMQAYMKQLELDNKTFSERFYQNWQTVMEGTQDVLSTGFFDFMNAEFKNIWDLFEKTGMNFKQMIDKMVSDFLATQLMKKLFGGMFAGDVSGTGLLGGLIETIMGGFGGPGNTPTTRGGHLGSYGFASGGIVRSPAVGAYAGGTFVMGEAGEEGILPLTRMANGKLGVSANVGTSSRNIFNFYVQAPGGKVEEPSMRQLEHRLGLAVRRANQRNG